VLAYLSFGMRENPDRLPMAESLPQLIRHRKGLFGILRN
jgi:hypothetical protein